MPSIVVGYLAGYEFPTFESFPSTGDDPLGITYRVYMDYAVGAADWRGAVYNDGV
jgi:hypothetical protein